MNIKDAHAMFLIIKIIILTNFPRYSLPPSSAKGKDRAYPSLNTQLYLYLRLPNVSPLHRLPFVHPKWM